MELFFAVAGMYMVLLLLRIVLIYIRDLRQEWIGLKLETDLRYASYDKLMELDSATIAAYNSGELLQTINNDTVMFKTLFALRIPYIVDAIFMLISFAHYALTYYKKTPMIQNIEDHEDRKR